jgi:type IV secretory pathway VirB3-like protein
MISGFFMFITSMVFVFVNQIIVESSIFVLLFVIPRIYVIHEAKKMSKKYNEMNERKEKQQIFKDLERELAEEKEKEEKNKG